MSERVIEINQLSKVYRIDPVMGRSTSKTLQEDLIQVIRRPFSSGVKTKKQEVWALRDVTLDVHRGDVIGLIGRNGAGKSTLLKILSSITEPTSGYADVYGRVGSLLEVGTGFHTELTGRENVYLSGAILGMRKIEIDRKFEQIVDFSGVRKYIETPIKRYSSGMAVRLAFSVAAHLEPEILLVDEVLAVGDAAFQKKCIGKMEEVAEGGRTVIFVSHNMAAISALCTRGIWLDSGGVKADGPVQDVVQRYLTAVGELEGTKTDLKSRLDRGGDGRVRFTSFQIRDKDGNPLPAVVSGEAVDLILNYETPDEVDGTVSVHFWICDAFGTCLLTLSSVYTGEDFTNLPRSGEMILHIPRFPLREGRYFVDLGVDVDSVKADRVTRAVQLDVASGAFYPVQQPADASYGNLLCDHSWHLRT
jgi:lipopolysaccharide transport system ATP-binding protein